MKKSFIAALLFSSVAGLNAASESLLFLNYSGNFSSGYTIQIKDENGNVLKTVENKKVVAVPRRNIYHLSAMKDGQQEGRTVVFKPTPKSTKRVVRMKFGKLFNRGINTSMMNLEDAEKKYKDVTFPK